MVELLGIAVTVVLSHVRDEGEQFASESRSVETPVGKDENPANFEIPRLIRETRKATDGNYEGVFGKITNFNFLKKFNPKELPASHCDFLIEFIPALNISA